MDLPLLWWVVIAIACLAAAGAAVAWKVLSGRAEQTHPYKKRRSLFTDSERAFLETLEQAVGEEYRIYAKVRAADALSVRALSDRGQWQRAWEKIRSKHFDFLLCDTEVFTPVAAVELDDASRDNPRRSVRDSFLESACRAAGLALVRIPAEKGDSVSEIRQKLLEELEELDTGQQPQAEPFGMEGQDSDSPPACPKCSSVMVRRRIKKGPRTGRMYWSCSRFPRCWGALPIQEE
jgi:hypothetical protein